MILKFIHKSYLFIFVTLAAIVYVFQKVHLKLPVFVNNYLNDILCIPILLKVSQLVIRHIKSNNRLKIPISLQIFVTTLYALVFEVILPNFHKRYTSDFLDVIAYFFGLIIFQIIESSINSLKKIS